MWRFVVPTSYCVNIICQQRVSFCRKRPSRSWFGGCSIHAKIDRDAASHFHFLFRLSAAYTDFEFPSHESQRFVRNLLLFIVRRNRGTLICFEHDHSPYRCAKAGAICVTLAQSCQPQDSLKSELGYRSRNVKECVKKHGMWFSKWRECAVRNAGNVV